MKEDILRPLDCIVLPLLAFHIILLFIALVTFVAVCSEAVSSRRPRSFFVKLEPRGTRPMPWIPPARRVPTATVFRENPRLQKIRCDLCNWETENGYLHPKKARAEAGAAGGHDDHDHEEAEAEEEEEVAHARADGDRVCVGGPILEGILCPGWTRNRGGIKGAFINDYVAVFVLVQ